MWNNSFFEQAGEMRHDSIMIFILESAFSRAQGGVQVASSGAEREPAFHPSLTGQPQPSPASPPSLASQLGSPL